MPTLQSCAMGVSLVAAIVLSNAGCSTFSSNVVSEDVVECRQNCQQGYAAIRQEQWEAADEHFNKAVEMCPADQRARSGYAEVLWHQGRRDEAIKQMKQAVQLSGGEARLRVQLGEMYLQQGDLAAARDQASRAIAAEKNLATAWALEGDALARNGQWEEALAHYHRALSFQADYPVVEIKTAEIYRRLARPQRAYSVLTKLEKRDGISGKSHRVLQLQALCCNELGRHGEAVHRWTDLANHFEPTPEVLHQLATAQWKAGQTDAARRTSLQALALDPSNIANQRLANQLGQGGPPLR